MARSSSQHQHTALDVPASDGLLIAGRGWGPPQSLTIVYTVNGQDHCTVIPYPKSYEARCPHSCCAALQPTLCFCNTFASGMASKGSADPSNRWIWAEIDPESFLNAIQDNAVEIRLCDNEQDGYDSDESDCLSVIMSEEESVQTNMTSLLQTDDGFKSSQSSMSNLSCLQTQTPSPAAIAQSLIDEAPSATCIWDNSLKPRTISPRRDGCSARSDPGPNQGKPPAVDHLDSRWLVPASTSLSTARSHFRHAHKLFTESKNRAGQLRCKQAVASIALDEQDWDSARSQILYILDAGKREGVEIDEYYTVLGCTVHSFLLSPSLSSFESDSAKSHEPNTLL
ncbi:hypothetical protein RHS01_05991 [Rhizoctonia solani]|uniref:Uncharacterized protein n=1 Tax=Rhizoctonia solani TaxID=456999 RepID=A0A8H7ICR1_9AGAM|nr:hypothetical protein RHS01_05991 [Rhizoctonia solani]